MTLLLPASGLYGLGVAVNRLAYRLGILPSTKVPVQVISVGNLTVGGTGKTPVVMALAEKLAASGKKVVILNRGYGAPEPLDYGEPRSAANGDEAWMMRRRLPDSVKVIVGRNRVANAKRAIEEHQPDVILLDDGFQHLKLKRDLDIVLIDGDKLLGNRHLLPVGPLREPLAALRRANAVWVTKNPSAESLERVRSWAGPGIPVVGVPFETAGFQRLSDDALLPPETLAGKPALAFSGIAQPEAFAASLKECGVTLVGHLEFGDHHWYTPADVDRILSRESEDTLLITTEKDRVKIASLIPEARRETVYTLLIRPLLPELPNGGAHA